MLATASHADLYLRWQQPWQTRAACRGADTEDFFPEPRLTVAEEIESSRVALQICRGCEVRRDCLERAFRNPEEFGVFGGTTPGQRAAAMVRVDRVDVLLTELDYVLAFTEGRTA